MRIDLATRRVDTVGVIKVPTMRMSMTQNEGRVMMRSMVDPLPVVDDWVVMPDRTVALIRGRDYRIEWVDADGNVTSSPRIPFDWQRLSDEDKVAFIDSVRVARERIVAEAEAAAASGDRAGATSAIAGAPGTSGFRIEMVTPGGGPPGGPGGGAARGGAQGPGGMQMPPVEFIDPLDLPDYKPPFFAGASRADSEGNIWIRMIPTRAIPGGPVYDVIDRKGELVERVQVPEGRTIVGFGAGGVVYMTALEGGVMRLEKALAR